MVSTTTTVRKHTNTPSPNNTKDTTTTTHNKRKLNELGDISNTPSRKQQKQQQQQLLNARRHHNNTHNSWQHRQRQRQQQQQLLNHTNYLNDKDVNITTPKGKKSASTATPDKPITRLNLKHNQLLVQEKHNQGVKQEEQQAQQQPPLKCKIKRHFHSSDSQENYTHQTQQYHCQTSPSPTDISSPPAMNQEEEYMLQEITRKPHRFNDTTTPPSDNIDSEDGVDQSHQGYQHRRCKSVTFKLPHDEEKGFENSPLLTPRNDDSDLEEEILARQQHQHQLQLPKEQEQEFSPVYPSTPPESLQHEDDHEEQDRVMKDVDEIESTPVEHVLSPPSQYLALEAKTESQTQVEEATTLQQEQQTQQLLLSTDVLTENTDYISLSSTLPLLENQRNQIQQEIIQLSKLKAQINTSSKEDTIGFVTKLLQGGNGGAEALGLPKPTPIVTCPYIQWEKYHPTLANISHELETESKKLNKNDTPFKFVI